MKKVARFAYSCCGELVCVVEQDADHGLLAESCENSLEASSKSLKGAKKGAAEAAASKNATEEEAAYWFLSPGDEYLHK